jgi:hypothetical protein
MEPSHRTTAMSTKVDSARKATGEVMLLVESARMLLEEDAKVNMSGVLMKPSDYEESLLAAIEDLTEAATLIKGTAWPTKRDYNED